MSIPMPMPRSVMWNVTDETPENSGRFLDQLGMELFLHCKEAFPNTMALLRNMMGLLGNIAEVKPGNTAKLDEVAQLGADFS